MHHKSAFTPTDGHFSDIRAPGWRRGPNQTPQFGAHPRHPPGIRPPL
ncbi:hypothetical protein PIN31115_00219 [Pandoraea iniqua]|uniref:Uncharacterized protein n=1 Tax=Pandoraea iniqua TaxID=2508288 RepID=A0A5E4RKC7_9BURK|nr:hypothetical protein PIN31115_00219 [Pandoraea iniqua]